MIEKNVCIVLLLFMVTHIFALQPVQAARYGMIYSTFVGGTNWEIGMDITMDGSGCVYIAGKTNSMDFPTSTGCYDGEYHGRGDAVVYKLSDDGTTLLYCTYLGGVEDDEAAGIHVDTFGIATVTGRSRSTDFPVTTGSLDTTHNGSWDAYISALSPDGTSLLYSTFVGGSGYDSGRGIILDSAGNAYITGWTGSTDFPTTPGVFLPVYQDAGDVFVTKLNSDGITLGYSTFLGGLQQDQAYDLDVDSTGNVYITGRTNSSDFPVVGGSYKTDLAGSTDVFISKLNPTGSSLVYSTYVGGTSDEFGYSIFVDSTGNALITGWTDSNDYDTTNRVFSKRYKGGGGDGFITKLNSLGTKLAFSTYIGGSDYDSARDITLDMTGNIVVIGTTNSSDFPTTLRAYDTSYNGGFDVDTAGDVFVSKLSDDGFSLIYSTYIGGVEFDSGRSVILDPDGYVHLVGSTDSPNFPVTAPAYDRTYNGGYDPVTAGDVFICMLEPQPLPPISIPAMILVPLLIFLPLFAELSIFVSGKK